MNARRRNSELRRGSHARERAQSKLIVSPKALLPPPREPVCEYSIDEVSNHEQRKRLAEYSESSSDSNPEETQAPDDTGPPQDIRRTRQLQKRASGLSVVSRTKVLRGVPTRLQVLFARQLKRMDFPAEGEDDIIARAGDSSAEYSRFMVLDDGFVDVIAVCPDGKEVVITRMGPGSIIGGMQSLGLTKTQLFTVRRAYMKLKSRNMSNGILDTSKPHLETDEVNKDDYKEISTPIELITYSISASDMAQLDDVFREELAVLKSRVLSDLHRFVVPHLERLASAGFFRRYCSAFVKRVVKNMDMRICKPGELIFKENSKAQSMAILFCGWIDIYVDGKFVSTQGEPGLCFGEAALLEDHATRTATVRSNDKSDCVVCLLQKDDFHAALNEFPDEKNRLEEQVKSKLTRLSMQAVFADCNHDFLHFLSAIADSTELEAGQRLYDGGTDMEELLMLQRGEAVALKADESHELLQKGAFIGIQGAIGLHRGPPTYVIQAKERGCSLVRITYDMLDKAFIYFPDQIASVLKDIRLNKLPDEHPFNHKDSEIWTIVQPLMCQAFMTMDFDVDVCKALAQFFKVEICDPGCTITEEGKDAHEMVLLLHGTVGWHTAGKVSTIATGPRYFDEGLIIGTQRRQTATITAKSMCVFWLLSNANLQAMRRCHLNVCKILDDAATLRRSLLLNLQARLRNMKTFRRFRSEILELISRSVDIRTYLPGDVIFGMGDLADCLYILLQGKAEALVNGRTGPLEEGSTFGEMALFGQVKRNMTVKAATLCVCNVVHTDIITYAFNQFPEDQHLKGPHSEPRHVRGALASIVAPRVKPSEEKSLNKPRYYKRSSNFASNVSVSTAGSNNIKQGWPNSVGAQGRNQRAMTVVGDQKTNIRDLRRAKSFPAKRRDSGEGGEGSDGLDDESSESSVSGDEEENVEGSDEMDTCDSVPFQVAEKPQSMPHISVPSVKSVENVFNLVEANSGPPSIAHSERDDMEYVATSPGPLELQTRFQHRSCLFHMTAPRIPPTEYQLYRSPKVAEEKMSAAFRNLMPRDAAATSARVHGLPSAARSRHQLDSLAMEMSRETFLSASGNVRQRRVWPTYTSPLPPVHQFVRAQTHNSAMVGSYPKETERTVAIAAQLQLLSSSLLRISSKASLQNLSQEVQQEPDQCGEEDMRDDLSAVSSKPSSAKGSRNMKRGWRGPHGDSPVTARHENARSVYEPQPPKRPRGEKQRPRRPEAFAYQAFSTTVTTSSSLETTAKMEQASTASSWAPNKESDVLSSSRRASAENTKLPTDSLTLGILPQPEIPVFDTRARTNSGNISSPRSADTGTDQRDSLTESKDFSLSGSISDFKQRPEVVGCENPDAPRNRNLLAPAVQTNKVRHSLGPTNQLLKELLVRRVQNVADDDTAAELEKFGEEGNFDDAYQLLREKEGSKQFMKRASIEACGWSSEVHKLQNQRYSSEGKPSRAVWPPAFVREVTFLIRRHVMQRCLRRAELAARRKDVLDAAYICRRACYIAVPQQQLSGEGDCSITVQDCAPLPTVDMTQVQDCRQGNPGVQPWESKEQQEAAELVAATVSFIAVIVCRASIKVSQSSENFQPKENTDQGFDSLLSWPSSTDELVVTMAAASCGERPTSRKKAPAQEGAESLVPILEPEQPPPRSSLRNSLKGNRRVRVSNLAEERAESIAVAFYVCRLSFEGAARSLLAKAQRQEAKMGSLLARKTLMASVSAQPMVGNQIGSAVEIIEVKNKVEELSRNTPEAAVTVSEFTAEDSPPVCNLQESRAAVEKSNEEHPVLMHGETRLLGEGLNLGQHTASLPPAVSITLRNIKIDSACGSLQNQLFDKCDPYVHFYIHTPNGGVTAQTSSKDNDCQPDWGEEEVVISDLGVTPTALALKIKIYDKDMDLDDKIAEGEVDMGTLQRPGGDCHLRVRVVNNLIFSDVWLELDYETSGWGN